MGNASDSLKRMTELLRRNYIRQLEVHLIDGMGFMKQNRDLYVFAKYLKLNPDFESFAASLIFVFILEMHVAQFLTKTDFITCVCVGVCVFVWVFGA